MRLWIDTDVGDNPDDAIALRCAGAHPGIELVGVSTVGAEPGERAELARRIVDAPVYDGDDDRLVDALRAAAPDALLAIGPLTNVAHLVDRRLALPELTVMGGVLTPVRHRGMVRRVEHNFGADPAATARVITHGGALIVPLDVTVSMRLRPDDLAQLLELVPDLTVEVGEWFTEQRHAGVPDDEVALVLHDPLALLACVRDVDIGIESRRFVFDASSGMLEERGAGQVHDVVTCVDARRAIARVLALLE